MTFDGLMTLGLVLETLALEELTLADMVGKIPAFSMKKGVIPGSPAQVYRAVDVFRKTYQDYNPDYTDGVRVDMKDEWFHVRASKTEPILRLIVEASEEDRADRLFNKINSQADEYMHRG
jgi:phosphomannomutase